MEKIEKGHMICVDAKMKRLLEVAENVALSRASVLITGESGTGKEVLAKYIHAKSSRANHRMIAINCAAVPDGLLESELFGYERGAFTGAAQSKAGKFEIAHNSTILLDELGEMPIHLQAKLLRVIQEGEVERLGAKHPIKINVRVIAATNRDLRVLVQQGKFREDLYYRLNVIPLEIPPLRTRRADIPVLANSFVEASCVINNKPKMTITKECMDRLIQWSWPGNVRELENILERAVLMNRSNLLLAEHIELPEQRLEESPLSLQAGMTVFEAEKKLIFKTLEYTNQNRTKAAKMLGISIRTLRNKLNEYRGGARK